MHSRCRLGAAGLTFGMLASIASAQTYGVTSLGLAESNALGANVSDLNSLGEVAASCGLLVDGDWTIGAVWTHGRWRYLLEPPGSMYVMAYGINDESHVVGIVEYDSDHYHGIIWTGDQMTEIPTLAGTEAIAWRINNNGVAVGGSISPNGFSHGFSWDGEQLLDLH